MITVLVCGGRNFSDETLVREALDKVQRDNANLRIIHGGCGASADAPSAGWRAYYKGADGLAHAWAEKNGHEAKGYPARWNSEGRAAGPKRNARMLEIDHPQLVVAFPGGDGTADMIAKARRASVPVIVVDAR